nr:unnamed protein product [Digitaria exilis]
MSTKRDHDHLTGPNNPAAPTKRVRASSPRNAPAPTLQSPPPSPLPVDLQLEIFARSDNVTTVVRCAATSKPLRRAILEPAFKSRLLARLAEPNNGDLLAAVSKRSVVIGRLLCPIEELVVLGATTDDDGTKLSAVLVEDDRVSVWTLSQRRVWSQQVWIRRAAIEEQLAGGAEEAPRSIRFEGFWGRSRTVLCRMAGVGLVRLDLETKKATVLCRCGELLSTDTFLF